VKRINTKNGNIDVEDLMKVNHLSLIVKQGVSQKISNNSSANNELIISVKVGKINIIH
jgi:hypothetical protein